MNLYKKIIIISLSISSLFSCSKSNTYNSENYSESENAHKFDGKNLKEIITDLYVEYLCFKYERTGKVDYDVDELKENNQIKSYVGHEGDVYAVSFKTAIPDNNNSNNIKYFQNLMQIRVGDYVSSTYYINGLPVIYHNFRLYSIDVALSRGIATLDFIKTFDEFQCDHTPEELEEIYL